MTHYDPLYELNSKIWAQGGFVNAHAHFDRAYTVTNKNMKDVVYNHLYQKWEYVDKYKREATEEQIYQNITTALGNQKQLCTSHCLTFIDVDPVVGFKSIRAAQRAKRYAKEVGIDFKIACQTLKGVVDKECQFMIIEAVEQDMIDVIGSLPGADKNMQDKHMDYMLLLGSAFDKRVHVHVDQLNTSKEKETEMLARKTIEYGMEGKVTAIHSISLACHPKWYRDDVYKICKDAGISFIACPTAWIDARRSEEMSPTHNAITPVDEMIEHDLVVALGSDNIHDIYKPYSTGDMKTELKFLLEATHIYDDNTLIKIARNNGLEVCGFHDKNECGNLGDIIGGG